MFLITGFIFLSHLQRLSMAGGSGGRRACLRSVAGLLMAIGVVLLSALLVVPSDSLQGGMSAMIKALPAGTRTALIKAGVVHAEVVSVASRSDANSVEAPAASSFPEQGAWNLTARALMAH